MRYAPEVLRRFDSPGALGELPAGEGTACVGEAGQPGDGLAVRFACRVLDGQIGAVAFRVFGCPHMVAACSLLAEQLQGAPVGTLRELDAWAAVERLAVPAAKRGGVLRIEDALRSCWAAWDNSGLTGSSVSRSDP